MDFMTVSELAARAGISRQWLNKKADSGEVPGVRRAPNGRLFIQDSLELDDWARDEAAWQMSNTRRHYNDKRRHQNNIEVWAKKVDAAKTMTIWLESTAPLDQWPDSSLNFVSRRLFRFVGMFDEIASEMARRKADKEAKKEAA
jgi:hypothetical protein